MKNMNIAVAIAALTISSAAFSSDSVQSEINNQQARLIASGVVSTEIGNTARVSAGVTVINSVQAQIESQRAQLIASGAVNTDSDSLASQSVKVSSSFQAQVDKQRVN